jgi:hypothetical protein
MAQGDVTIFNEAKAKMLDGDWASTDNFSLAICDNTTAPTAATVTPTLGDFTQVGAAGSYTSGGTSLGALSALVTQTGGAAKFDSGTNPTWAKHASNDVDAYWGIIYNSTDVANDAIAYVDLGGPVDMTAGDLTVNWHANGIITW